MQYLCFGHPDLPAVMLIHGGGWSQTFIRHAKLLQNEYHVIVPVLDGYGQRREERYRSTANAAEQLLRYIDENCNGRLFSICGVSLGGQIVVEMLTRRNRLAASAIIEGVLCIPQPKMVKYGKRMHRWLFRLMTSGLMSRRANRAMPPNFRLSEEEMESCVREMKMFHNDSIDALFLSHASYSVREELRKCEVPLLCMIADKDPLPIRRSASLLQRTLSDCWIEVLPGHRHGELGVHRPLEWVAKARAFWDAQRTGN